MARKIRLIVLVALLVAALLALILPLILRSEPVRSELAERLGYHLESEISLDSIELAWFPTPHLLVRGVDVRRDELRLALPETHVFPRYTSLLLFRLEPSRVVLTEPELQFDPSALLSEEPSVPGVFPRTFTGKVEIIRGVVSIDDARIPGAVDLEAMELTEIDAAFRVTPTRLEVDLALQPSFGRHLTLQGHLTKDETYYLQANAEGLLLHEVITTPVQGVAPLEAMANLKLTAEGAGFETIDARLTGELPCFLLNPQEIAPQTGVVRLDCGVIDLSLNKQEDDWQLLIHDFEVTKPELRLNGVISRKVPAEESPRWDIELQGRDLNADEIMPAVLELFGEYKPARKVGEIVLGGRASRASFQLSGNDDELRDPRTLADMMILEVDVQRAEIMVPGIDLYLPEARGPLRIENSILELSGAEARLGNSHGRDGSLRVGLRRDLPLLQLDMQLDADLQDLRAVLPELLNHPVFLEEMKRFPSAQGEASGRLVIGDNWHDFTVDATIEQGRGEIIYDRLPWPLTVQRGRFLIDRELVRWRGLEATAGPHRLKGSTGRVALSPEAPFVLEKTKAVLDSGSLFGHLLDYQVLEEAIIPVLEDIDGPITIDSGQASGELFRPITWQYSAEIDLDNGGLTWYSPLLATEVTCLQGRLRIDDERVDLHQVELELRDGYFSLDSRLRHQTLRNWRGMAELGGLLTPDIRTWLEQRQWLPESFLPQAPLTLAPLTFNWDDNSLVMAGNLHSGENRELSRTSLEFMISSHDQHGVEIESTVLDDDRQARFDLSLHRGYRGLAVLLNRDPALSENGLTPVHGSFEGELNQGVLADFFAFFDQHLEMGNCRGEASFKIPTPLYLPPNTDAVPHPDLMAPYFAGQLAVRGLSWSPEVDEQRRITVNELDLEGHEQQLQLRQMDISLDADQRLELAGGIKTLSAGLEFDLDLSAPYLRWQTLLSWYDELKSHQPRLEIISEPRQWPVTGRVDFHLEDFDSGPLPAENETPSLRWQPLTGNLSLSPATGLVADIESGVLCLLEITGTWYLNPDLGTSSFAVAPATEEIPRFEKMSPCLGIEQDIITGDCQLKAEFHGDFAHWEKGVISIDSPGGGRIKRMGLLARILSVVNITDIFTGDIAGLDEEGFAYRELEFEALIEDHVLTIEKAVVRGVGLNLIARGSLDLADYEADMVVLVAPFKTIDTLVSWIPFLGRIIGGEDATLLTIPVAVKGDIRDPRLIVMSPDSVGEGLLNLIKSTLMLPFNILSPILPSPDPDQEIND